MKQYSEKTRVYTKTCDQCGESFETANPKRKNGMFCSKECRNAARWPKCRQCGGQFDPKGKKSKYCSIACCGKAQRKTVTVTCERCGKVVEKTPCQLAKNERQFCSNECSEQRLELVGSCRKWAKGVLKKWGKVLSGHVASMPERQWLLALTRKMSAKTGELRRMSDVTGEARWRQQCGVMVQMNQYRTVRRKTECDQTKGDAQASEYHGSVDQDWMAFCVRVCKPPRQLTSEQKDRREWKTWIHNKLRSQSQRLERKGNRVRTKSIDS